ncbi:hypothetical protein DAPPUDRAFT_332807 [Daphnia pulex]|uniref:Uncharacterized protein n=1 Tax=Daphnia pulex TaxID=6669 RepID=E9HR07_DAPPU|nr:hypothetical protein DAPPUDRAFT_332807 [Daphnia pulex]|eukprot:EFX65826.1 hypothetical protein DAPPUDRAFT_332807 [Daphnia pulex]
MWLEKKHIYTEFWGWQTSTQVRIPMETTVTDCEKMRDSRLCNTETMDYLGGNKWSLERVPNVQGKWLLVTGDELVNCRLEEVTLETECSNCTISSPIGDIPGGTNGSISHNLVTVIWKESLREIEECKLRLVEQGIALRFMTDKTGVERIRDVEQQLDFVYNTTSKKFCNSSENILKPVLGMDKVSWSLPIHSQQTLRRQLNSEEPLLSEPTNQQVNSSADQIRSDQLDPRSYEERRNNWAEQFNHLRQTEEPESVVLQNDSDNHSNIPEPLIGDNTRDVLSYNQLLEQARAILDSSETPETNTNLREDPTNLVDIDFSNEGVDRSYFCTQFLHTRITDVPVDDLIFELQYLRKLNQREDITNTEIESALRALLLTEPTIITPFELFSHCQLKTNYEPPTESEYESVVSEREDLIEQNSNLLPLSDQETELIPDDRLVTIPVSSQVDLVISTTSAPITPSNPTLPSAIEKTSTSTPSPFTSTPISHQPKLPSRRVTFPPFGTTAQGGNSPTAGMSTGGKKPDIPVIIYAGELSRLLESGMSYEDASVAAIR